GIRQIEHQLDSSVVGAGARAGGNVAQPFSGTRPEKRLHRLATRRSRAWRRAPSWSGITGAVRPIPARFLVALVFYAAMGCEAHASAGSGYVSEAGPVARPPDPLDRKQAEQFVLALVNHDRKAAGLSEVQWDETA